MSPTLLATLLILLSAVLHAAVNALVKVSDDGLLTRGCMNACALLVSLPLLAWVAPPSPAVWAILLVSMLVHGLYPFFLVGAYRRSDLSTVMPLARGTTPLGVAALALVFAGEHPGLLQLGGVLIISLGIALLAFERGAAAAWQSRHGMAYAVATGAIIACYTVLDGIGVRRAETPSAYIVWLFVLDGGFVALTVGLVRRSTAGAFIRRNWRACLAGGALGIASYALALYALSLGAMAAVAALRETSVIFAAVIGAVLLREPFGRRRLLAAVIVTCGVIVLQLGAAA